MSATEAHAPSRTGTFDCKGPAELVLVVRAGRIEVRTADVRAVRVEVSAEVGEAPGREREAHAVRETQVGFSEESRRLVVRTPRGFRGVRLSVVVEAPRGSRLVARANRGSVTAVGELTGLNAATHSGEIAADRIDGEARVQTGSGDVRLGRVAGTLRARSGSGELEVASLEGDEAKLSGGSGDIWLGVVRSDVRARAGSGSVVVEDAASGRLDLAAGSGDVRVGVRAGVSAEIDVVSGSGRARSELEVSDAPPHEAPRLRIRARTGSGDALVTRADGRELPESSAPGRPYGFSR